MPRSDEQEFLDFCLKGHADAIEFVKIVFRASQVLDDLIDKDRPVGDEDIVDMFWDVLIDLPMNTFYRQHVDTLVPLMRVYLQDWEDATKMESTNDHGQNIAFVLRDTVGGIITHVAGLVGGRYWQKAIAVTVREHIHEDSLEDYKKELSE